MWGMFGEIGSSLLGGLFGSKGQKDANTANTALAEKQMLMQQRENQLSRDWQANQNLIGRNSSDYWNHAALNLAKINYARSVEKDRYGITERVQDARRAGLHPLFAMGASLSGHSPSSFSAGQSPTGSAASSGIGGFAAEQSTAPDFSGIGSAISGYANRRANRKAIKKATQERQAGAQYERARQAAIDASVIRRNDAEANESNARALLSASQIKRAEQLTNQKRHPGKSQPGNGSIARLPEYQKYQNLSAVDPKRNWRNPRIFDEETYGELGQLATAIDPYLQYLNLTGPKSRNVHKPKPKRKRPPAPRERKARAPLKIDILY